MRRKYKVMLLSITILLFCTIFLGTSYSVWTATSKQEGTNVINVGCFSVTFTNLESFNGNAAGDINLSKAYPVSEEVGSTLTPYIFKVKNECSVASNYTLNLETLNETNFNLDYLRVKFNNTSDVTTTSSVKYNTLTDGNIVLTDASIAKVLTTGHLEANDEVTYSLRTWIDEEATTETESVMGKTWKGKVTLSTEATASIPHVPTASETITALVDGEDSSSTDVIDKGTDASGCTNTLAYDGTSDNNLRYVGSNPCNYVTYNGELWRIIGVMNNIKTGGTTENLVKIIRNESLGDYSWDSSESGINGGYGINQWGESNEYEGSDLMRELNYDYLGNIQVGTDGKWYNGTNNLKTIDMPTSTLNTNAQSMIEDVVWNLGSPSNNNGSYDSNWTSNITPSTTYTRERANTNGKVCSSGTYCKDTVTRTSTWTGKIGLMYPSDYGYATVGGSTTTRLSCLSTSLNSWNGSSVSDCKNNDWLYNSMNNQWTLSPLASSSAADFVLYVWSGGYVSTGDARSAFSVRPAVFLKSGITITGGTGTSTNPYTLG